MTNKFDNRTFQHKFSTKSVAQHFAHSSFHFMFSKFFGYFPIFLGESFRGHIRLQNCWTGGWPRPCFRMARTGKSWRSVQKEIPHSLLPQTKHSVGNKRTTNWETPFLKIRFDTIMHIFLVLCLPVSPQKNPPNRAQRFFSGCVLIPVFISNFISDFVFLGPKHFLFTHHHGAYAPWWSLQYPSYLWES